MVADVLGLGFALVAANCGRRVVRVPHIDYQAKKPWDEFIISTALSYLPNCIVQCTSFRASAGARTKKAAWLAATAGLVSARRGLILTCKPSWLANAQHLSKRWSPQYPVLLSCYFVRINLPRRVARNW